MIRVVEVGPGETPELNLRRFANLTSMAPGDDFVELVWQNGQIFTTASYSCNNPKPEAYTAGDTYPRKRPKLGSMKSSLGLSGHQELANNDEYPEFRLFMETSRNSRRDEYNVEPQIVPVCEGENTRAGNFSVGPNTQVNDQLPQCQVSAVFSRSIMDGKKSVLMGELGDSNSQQWNSSRVEELKEKFPAKESFYKCVDQTRRITSPPKEPVPDEQSEAPVHSNGIKSKRIPVPNSSSLKANNTVKRTLDQLAAKKPTSLCSASNDLTHSSFKRHQETASLNEDADEEERVPKSATSGKKKRTQQVHSLSERKRRDRINKKMRALQALIPNSNMMDKASMLDNAIAYLKTLQLQLQVMSMGNSLYMPQMMIPTATQQIQAPGLAHLMGMRMPMNPAAMFGIAAAPQMLPMTSHPPFLPFFGPSSTLPIFAMTPITSAPPLFTSKQSTSQN